MNLTVFNQLNCDHFSCPERPVSPVDVLLCMCGAAVLLLTVCGNLLVIISVLHFKQLHTPTNMLVLSLAVSDFFVGAFVMPPVFIWRIKSCWIFGTGFCISFWLTAGFLMLLSIYNVALIAVDRYLALSSPFFYMQTISKRAMCIVVYSNWCVCLVYSVAFCYINVIIREIVICPGECSLSVNEHWFIIDLVISFIFPLSVIIIFYTLVFIIAKKHATAIRELNNHTHKITSHSMKSERKAAKVLGVLVCVFLVFLLPYFISSLLSDVIGPNLETLQTVLIIGHLNSTINPVIYALFYPWFRRCFKLIITLQIFQTDSALSNVFS